MTGAIADLDPDLMANSARGVGHTVKVFRATASTNDLLLRLGEAGEPEGLAVIADAQTAGRGRFGRKWHSEAGLGLWLSILVRPTRPLTEWGELTLIAARSIIAAVRDLNHLTCVIKPPNDVFIHGRKLAGILVETRTGRNSFAVVGMGVNVHHGAKDFPSPVDLTATSLAMEGSHCNRARLAAEILDQFDFGYRQFIEISA